MDDFTKFGININNLDEFEAGSKMIKRLYDSFVKAGFTDDVAFKFTMAMINTVVNLKGDK